jgi:hypothetical protein
VGAEIHVGLYIKCPLLLLDFNQNQSILADIRVNPPVPNLIEIR